jgi:NADPH:quinone reductase-like Zn-dependent oxidoreductase
VGQRVFGLTDWTRDGTLAEYVAVEARNLAPLRGDVDFTVGAALVMPGLTAWQGLFEHGRLRAGQSVLMVAPKLFISWGPKLLWVPSFGA